METSLRAAALALPALLVSSVALADVAPDLPETWRAELVSANAEGPRMEVALAIRNDGDASVSLVVDVDTSMRDGDQFTNVRAASARVGPRALAIETQRRGPHEVRATEAFTVPAGGSVIVTLVYAGDRPLAADRASGILVHEARAWRGVRVDLAARPRPPALDNAVTAPAGTGCSCRAARPPLGRLSWLPFGALLGAALLRAKRRRAR